MKKQNQRYRVSLLGRRFDITRLIADHLQPAHQLYKQVRDALNHGVDPKVAYSMSRSQLSMLRRYERALALYNEYRQAVGTPRADRILTLALPTAEHHVVHFFCASSSDKQEHAYTHYKVVLARKGSRKYIFCDCPDFINRGVREDGTPCKHIYLTLLYLCDHARAEKR